MNLKTLFILTIGTSMVISGCSSRPREFTPSLAAPPEDRSVFDQAYADCRQLLVDGKLDQNGRLASAGAGAATGAGVAVAGGALASSTIPAVGAALASATVVLLPFAIVGGAVGMAKIKRAKKEEAIKSAMTGCLRERGYEISGWKKMSKAEIARANAAKTATPAPVPPNAH